MSCDFELVDVCHTIEHGMITYKGLPAPVISDYLTREESRSRYAPGTEFHIGKIEMVANTGTYLDSPFHRYARGKDLAALDLYSLANLDGIVMRCLDRSEPAITEGSFIGIEVKGKAVLVHTGWDKHWRTEEYSSGNHPYLTEGAATYLVKNDARLVGIDSFNIDATHDGNRPAHSTLLGHDIPIVEHLCGLGDLPDRDFKFFAVPVKVRQFGTFPVRAFGLVLSA
ncbi:MAG TPA: cyclase family protein [Pyrinomonadaceae bacterium]|nr:cyclase family protein [Pyrinomonadaceae bacterium]